jgi:metallo-beta-lactamase class B
MGTMRRLRRLAFLACFAGIAALSARAEDHPTWTTPLPPFRLADNLYYVGSQDLAAYLVTTPAGNILINANLPSSPPQIRHSVEQLGFRWADTKIVLNGQAHYDHVGGLAEVLRETHAQDMVMEYDAQVVESGGRTDFLHPTQSLQEYPRAHVDRVLHDGDTVSLGGVVLTAHRTGGHTRGCTTWTMRVHLPGEPAGKLRDVVIVGGYSFWSEYHFVATPGHPASYPGIAEDFKHTFATLHRLPCDVFLGAHGDYFGMDAKLKRMPMEGAEVWVDPQGYQAAVSRAEAAFEKALKEQEAGTRRR